MTPSWRACFGEKGMRTYITNGERTIYTSKDDADFLRDALNAAASPQTLVPVVRTCEDCGADIYSHSEPR